MKITRKFLTGIAIAAIAAATFPDASPSSLPRAAVEAHIALHLSEAAVAAWIADPERIVLVGAAADAPETLLGYAMYETAATPEAPVTERLGDVPAGDGVGRDLGKTRVSWRGPPVSE